MTFSTVHFSTVFVIELWIGNKRRFVWWYCVFELHQLKKKMINIFLNHNIVFLLNLTLVPITPCDIQISYNTLDGWLLRDTKQQVQMVVDFSLPLERPCFSFPFSLHVAVFDQGDQWMQRQNIRLIKQIICFSWLLFPSTRPVLFYTNFNLWKAPITETLWMNQLQTYSIARAEMYISNVYIYI
jgi:hypothetical protein